MTKNSGEKNRKKKSFMRFIENNALQTEEKIVINIVTHPSKLFYIWILGILGIWLFLIPTIFAIIKTIEYKNKEYVITNKRVIAKYGKRKVYYEAINLDKIIDVSVYIGFFGKLFGFGDVLIQSMNNNHLSLIGIKNSDEVKNNILLLKKIYRNRFCMWAGNAPTFYLPFFTKIFSKNLKSI